MATGPLQHESRRIERDAAERVRVSLHMNAGELRVTGGSPKLMEGDFTYNMAGSKPDVRYRGTGAFGDLTVEEPSIGRAHVGNHGYTWDLRFSNEVPLDIKVQFGAGEAWLDMGSLDLRNVDVEMGAGQVQMDLRGSPKRDYGVRIRGGVGEATVRLPRDTGIYAEASGGLGSINVHGLRHEGDHWINDAYRSGGVRIRLDVHGGIGAINLIAD
jgi:hypothetical protein